MKLFLRYFLKYTLLLVAILVAIPSIVAGSVTAGLLFARFKEGHFVGDEIQTLWKAGLIAVGGSLVTTGACWLRWRYFTGPDRSVNAFRLTPPQTSRQTRWVWYFNTLIYGGGMAVLLWQRSEGETAPRILEVTAWMLLLFLGLHARILVHEVGHLIAAWLTGITATKLQVGTGAVVFRCQLQGGMLLEWRLLPGGGLVDSFYLAEKGHRWRYWLMILGGPAANVTLLLIIAWCLLDETGHLPLLAELRPGGLVLAALGGWTAMMTLINFVPFKGRVGDRLVLSDGWQLLTLWRLPQARVVERIINGIARRIDFFCQNGKSGHAWELQRQLTARYPDKGLVIEAITGAMHQYDQHFAAAAECYQRVLARDDLPPARKHVFQVQVASSWMQDGQIERARQYCEATLAEAEADERVQLLDGFACIPITTGNHQLLDRARQWAEEALQLKPDKLTLSGTWGALLVEEGRLEEGEKALRRVCSLALLERDRGISWYYRALIAQRRGESARKVRRLCRRARWMCPEFWLHERIRKTLSASGPHAVEPSAVPHAVA